MHPITELTTSFREVKKTKNKDLNTVKDTNKSSRVRKAEV